MKGLTMDEDITITINHSVGDYPIEFIQQIEKALDEALVAVGFTRTTTTKGDTIIFNYHQFGICCIELS